MQDYRKLVVWQRAHQLTLAVYTATKTFPDDERYGLTSQTRCAALSIPANIVEGCGRGTQAEFRRFLYIAMGSARELDYHLLLAHDLGYLSDPKHHELARDLDEIQRMLNAFIQRLKPDSGLRTQDS
jgi:four helix bundle protein